MSTHHFLLEVLCKPLLQGRKKTLLRSRVCIARGGTGRAAGLSPRGRLSQGAAVATTKPCKWRGMSNDVSTFPPMTFCFPHHRTRRTSFDRGTPEIERPL